MSKNKKDLSLKNLDRDDVLANAIIALTEKIGEQSADIIAIKEAQNNLVANSSKRDGQENLVAEVHHHIDENKETLRKRIDALETILRQRLENIRRLVEYSHMEKLFKFYAQNNIDGLSIMIKDSPFGLNLNNRMEGMETCLRDLKCNVTEMKNKMPVLEPNTKPTKPERWCEVPKYYLYLLPQYYLVQFFCNRSFKVFVEICVLCIVLLTVILMGCVLHDNATLRKENEKNELIRSFIRKKSKSYGDAINYIDMLYADRKAHQLEIDTLRIYVSE